MRLALAISLLLFAGCQRSGEDARAAPVTETTASAVTSTTAGATVPATATMAPGETSTTTGPEAHPEWTTFDPSKVEAGTKVGAWSVRDVTFRPDPSEQGWTGEVRFSGEVSLSGTFQPHFDSEVKAACFFVDLDDAAKLPRFANDVRKPWFCFQNEEEARSAAPVGTRATIRVSDYHYAYSHTDVVNSVKLLTVEKRQ